LQVPHRIAHIYATVLIPVNFSVLESAAPLILMNPEKWQTLSYKNPVGTFYRSVDAAMTWRVLIFTLPDNPSL
jgi:hypothetical protein